MPIYTWYDEVEKKEYDVYKATFDQSKEEPKDEELPEAERGKERKWVKRVGRGIRVVHAPGFGSKGNW